MKLIDHSPQESSGSSSVLKKFQSSVQDALKLGASDEELKAQETFAQQLGKTLDNRFTLLRNIRINPNQAPIPMILVGPPGILVINANADEGIYRAKGESWLIMDNRLEQYKTASKNLVSETLAYSEAVDKFFLEAELQLPEPLPILFMSHPGVHIDANQPAVRIVRMDGVDRLATGILQGDPTLDAVQIQDIAERLERASEANQAAAKPETMPEDVTDVWREETEVAAAQPAKPLVDFDLPPALEKMGLSNNQVLLLAVMIVVEVVFILIFIFFVLMTV
jgi:hypothetical protein